MRQIQTTTEATRQTKALAPRIAPSGTSCSGNNWSWTEVLLYYWVKTIMSRIHNVGCLTRQSPGQKVWIPSRHNVTAGIVAPRLLTFLEKLTGAMHNVPPCPSQLAHLMSFICHQDSTSPVVYQCGKELVCFPPPPLAADHSEEEAGWAAWAASQTGAPLEKKDAGSVWRMISGPVIQGCRLCCEERSSASYPSLAYTNVGARHKKYQSCGQQASSPEAMSYLTRSRMSTRLGFRMG